MGNLSRGEERKERVEERGKFQLFSPPSKERPSVLQGAQ